MGKHHNVVNSNYEYINFIMTLVWRFHSVKRLSISTVKDDTKLKIGNVIYDLDYVVNQFIIAEGFAIEYPLVTEFYVNFYKDGSIADLLSLLKKLVEVTKLK